MSEKQAQISSEAAQAAKVQSAPQAERQSPEHLDGAWGEARAQVERAVGAFGAASSQQNPASNIDSALGRLGGSASVRAGLVMQLQRRYGNASMSRLIQRRASGEKALGEGSGARVAARKQDDGRDAEEASARELPEGFASSLEGTETGAPLDLSTRLFMESRFGQSFDDVRIHSDASAGEAARRVSAQAFTAGRDIYFGRELYRPDTREGRQLLAHELTHVAQQRAGRAATDAAAPALSLPQDSFEQEAERAASHVVAGGSFVVSEQPSGASVASRSIIARQEKKADDAATNTAVGKTGESGTSEAVPADNQSPAGKMDTDRLARIEAIHAKTWVDNDDEVELEQIWESFGSSLPSVAQHNSALWEASVNYGADLYDIPTVVKLRKEFAEDVRETARQYLHVNREYVRDEMARLGLTEGEEQEADAPTPEQDLYLQEVQQAADKIEQAQEKRTQLATIYVGYGPNLRGPGRGAPMQFDPKRKPNYPLIGTEEPPGPTWEEVKEQYDALTNVINGLASRYPSLFAVTRSERVKDVLTNDPEQARGVVEGVLREVLANIDETFVKLVPDGDIDYYDLQPIHEQFFGGMGAPSGNPWGRDFYKKVAKEDLEEHESRAFWEQLGLSTLAAAAFVVAEIATLGTATFFAATAVGTTAAAAQVGASWEQYLDLSQTSRTNVTEETALVSEGQASAALVEAIINTAAFFLDIYAPFAKLARGLGKTVVKEGAEAAAQQAAKREALEASSREVAELAAGEVAERKSISDLSRKTAEVVEGAGTLGARQFSKIVRELFTEVVNRIKTWARKAYEMFGFKAYVVEMEGDKLVLYGIRSKVKLLECDISYLNEYTFENKGALGDKVLSREQFLDLARKATNKAMRNAYRRSAIELSEDIGEIVGERALRKHLKLGGAGSLKRLHRGSGSGTLDLIYRLPDGSIAIVEAKGGAGRIGTRLIEKGVRSKQGTWEYLESILISMGEKPGQSKVAEEVWEALEAGKVQYYLTETPIEEGASTVTTTIKQFDYDF
ncbi:MAG TPA: DUF4157 domain-containing protein [Pyrinomonadaceae bacterium]|jgi:hypothetical protein